MEFSKLFISKLQEYGLVVRRCNVRYGSVIYFGFGDVVIDAFGAERNLLELELGSDAWLVISDGDFVLMSSLDSVDKMQRYLPRILNKMVTGIEISSSNSNIQVGEILISSEILEVQCSGFLYSLDEYQGLCVETLDGIACH